MENPKSLKIAFFGSSIVSAYWNGAATYYRGIVKSLYKQGHRVTFYEPDIYERQSHRDIDDPDYCEVVVYPEDQDHLKQLLVKAQKESDIIIKTSGVGAFDTFLEAEVPKLKTASNAIIFWDVDAPATLDRVQNDAKDPFRNALPLYDCVFTYGGGVPVTKAYLALGARACHPIYNALDTDTHFPVEPTENFDATLNFLGNRLPDREARVMEFFFKPAALLPEKSFIIGGSGWGDVNFPSNVHYVGHVFTKDHNTFNASPMTVLNISRESMFRYGFSPATRVFEAAGAGACIITDYWEGIDYFFEPDIEILVARDGKEVAEILNLLTPERAREIGRAAYKKVLEKHTYNHRAKRLEKILMEITSHTYKNIAL